MMKLYEMVQSEESLPLVVSHQNGWPSEAHMNEIMSNDPLCKNYMIKKLLDASFKEPETDI
jgi:hypothetical protein